MHYYVIGVNGSGKTTLLNYIYENLGLRVVHGTTELMRQLGIPGDYDSLRKMNQDDVLSEWGKTALHLLDKYRDEHFLLDTHILNLTNGKTIRRDGPWIANYDALILVKAQPNTLLTRIVADSDKDRALFTPEMSEVEKLEILAAYQDDTEKLFTELSEKYKLPSLIINNDDDIEHSAESFSKFHQAVSR